MCSCLHPFILILSWVTHEGLYWGSLWWGANRVLVGRKLLKRAQAPLKQPGLSSEALTEAGARGRSSEKLSSSASRETESFQVTTVHVRVCVCWGGGGLLLFTSFFILCSWLTLTVIVPSLYLQMQQKRVFIHHLKYIIKVDITLDKCVTLKGIYWHKIE